MTTANFLSVEFDISVEQAQAVEGFTKLLLAVKAGEFLEAKQTALMHILLCRGLANGDEGLKGRLVRATIWVLNDELEEALYDQG